MDIRLEDITDLIKDIIGEKIEGITTLLQDYIDQEIDNAIDAEKDCMADKEANNDNR